MRSYLAVFFFLFAGFIMTASFGESAPSQQGPPSSLQPGQPPPPTHTNPKPLQDAEAVSFNDFSELNLSTPKKSVISFLDQLNGIMPVSPITDLQEICAKVAQPSCQKECMVLLETRLSHLKSISKNLKGAYFVPQSLKQVSESPWKFKAAWKEQLTFNDGTTKLTDMGMSVVLEKSGEEWKILRIERDQEQ